jgi:hypothetical protein
VLESLSVPINLLLCPEVPCLAEAHLLSKRLKDAFLLVRLEKLVGKWPRDGRLSFLEATYLPMHLMRFSLF